MTEHVQTDILTALAELPQRHPCPSCRGNRQRIRVLYPDEALERGVLTAVEACRTCRGAGWVPWDPNDHTEIPY